MSKVRNLAVLTVGDVMIDFWLYGRYERQTNEYGRKVHICDIMEETITCGGAANVARHISSLQGCSFLIGAIGDDMWGREFPNLCASVPIATYSVIDSSRRTTVKTRVIGGGVENYIRFDREDRHPLSLEKEDQIIHRITCLAHQVDVFVISDYNKGVVTEKIVECVMGFGKPVIIDLKRYESELCGKYEGATLIKPNILDLDDNDLNNLELYAPLAVTYGIDGIELRRKGQEALHYTAWNVPVKDAIGAGDAVIAGMTVALASGLSLEEVVHMGNLAGATSVTQEGTLGGITVEQMDDIQLRYKKKEAF